MLKNHPPAWFTKKGACHIGDSLELLAALPDNSLPLVMTSPPFALLRQKEYGNESQAGYVKWLANFGRLVHQKLRPDGSFVLDLGGAYQPGLPVRSLYNYRVLIEFCDHLGFHLAEEFFWFNPAKLPSPIEWVNKRNIRAKDSVNTVWWFSKTPWPKADVRQVLTPYSDRMKKLLKNPALFYSPKDRPSGHDISDSFSTDNGGVIPSNLLQIPNTESNSNYLAICKKLGLKSHPARFPMGLPAFFIQFLTTENDLVVDIFSGSNTTGQAAEKHGRRWLSIDLEPDYVAASAFRFLPKNLPDDPLLGAYAGIKNGLSIDLSELMKTNLALAA